MKFHFIHTYTKNRSFGPLLLPCRAAAIEQASSPLRRQHLNLPPIATTNDSNVCYLLARISYLFVSFIYSFMIRDFPHSQIQFCWTTYTNTYSLKKHQSILGLRMSQIVWIKLATHILNFQWCTTYTNKSGLNKHLLSSNIFFSLKVVYKFVLF